MDLQPGRGRIGDDGGSVRRPRHEPGHTETSQNAFDGTAIYVPTVASQTDPVNGRPDVLVIDPTMFEVTETIETLGANSTNAADGALWVVDTAFGILQRFDRDG